MVQEGDSWCENFMNIPSVGVARFFKRLLEADAESNESGSCQAVLKQPADSTDEGTTKTTDDFSSAVGPNCQGDYFQKGMLCSPCLFLLVSPFLFYSFSIAPAPR